MDYEQSDMSCELMVDGNAVAGLLRDIFGAEMSASTTECTHCEKVGQIVTLLAFTQGPGVVLRCPPCEGVMLRVVETTGVFAGCKRDNISTREPLVVP